MPNILAIQYPVFKPAMRIISNVTNGFPASVTTTFDHGYITGMIVRLIIPLGYGMVQANQKHGTITVTSSTTFDITIDTTKFDAYVTPSTSPQDEQYPQVVPFGEVNSILTASVQNVLPY